MKELFRYALLFWVLIISPLLNNALYCEEFNLDCPLDPKEFITEDMTPKQKAYVDRMARSMAYAHLADYEYKNLKEIAELESSIAFYKKNKMDPSSYSGTSAKLERSKDEYQTAMKVMPKLRPMKKKCFLEILDRQDEIDLDDQKSSDRYDYQKFINYTYRMSKVIPAEKEIFDKYIPKFKGKRILKSTLEEAERDSARDFFIHGNMVANKTLTKAKLKTPKSYSQQVKQDFIDACMASYHYSGTSARFDKLNTKPLTKEFEPVCKKIYGRVVNYKEMDVPAYTQYLKVRTSIVSDPALVKDKFATSDGFVPVDRNEASDIMVKSYAAARDFSGPDMEKFVSYQKMHLIFQSEQDRELKNKKQK